MENNVKCPIRVLGARIVVLEEKQEEKTLSGIIVPGREKEPTFMGIVVAVGEGAMLDNGQYIPVKVNIEEKIIYNNWSGSPINVDDKTFLVLNERDVLGVFQDNEECPIKPLGARILIVEDKQEAKTSSGIIVPGREKEQTFRGTVVAVGEGLILDNGTLVPIRVNVGDKIVYNNWTGSPVSIKDNVYMFLGERDILAVLPE